MCQPDMGVPAAVAMRSIPKLGDKLVRVDLFKLSLKADVKCTCANVRDDEEPFLGVAVLLNCGFKSLEAEAEVTRA